MKKAWSITRWFFVILSTCLITSGTLSYSGFCFKEISYLSKQEKINAAVEYIFRNQAVFGKIWLDHPVLKNPPKDIKEIIEYKSIDDFFRENLNCCKLTDKLNSSEGVRRASFLDQLFGFASTFVVVEYKVKFLTNDNVEDYRINIIPSLITNCGVSWLD